MKKISIITVTYNNAAGLQKTLDSIESQTVRCFEHIIVDGDSNDNTPAVMAESGAEVKISEKDRGIYDAMNKGIQHASCEWLYFLNAGDILYDEKAMAELCEHLTDDHDLVYGNVKVHGLNNRTLEGDYLNFEVHHQALIYRKSLHEKHNKYLVVKGFSPADYLFFAQCHNERWLKIDRIFAQVDDYGLSSSRAAVQKRIVIDFILERRKAIKTWVLFSMYPAYRVFKRSLFRIKRIFVQ